MPVRWRRHLPLAPELPRALWGTASALLLALGSYGFRAEVWASHPAAGGWSLVLLPVLVVAGLLQLLNALYNWLAALAGPGWLRLVLRAAVAAVRLGTALLMWLVSVAALIALAMFS